MVQVQKAASAEAQAAMEQVQALQQQLQVSSAAERRVVVLEEANHSQQAEIMAMRATMEEYERGAEEVQNAHQELQLKYQQGQTELAAAQVAACPCVLHARHTASWHS